MQSLAIAIPVYNNSSLLRECLHSIQIQSSKEFDVHIYDDDSTENYLSILKSFSDFPIIYTRNKSLKMYLIENFYFNLYHDC